MFPNQNTGSNLNIIRDALVYDVDVDFDKMKLLMAIDQIGCRAYWTDADYKHHRANRIVVDVPMEKNFTRRDTFLFYLGWMADVWIDNAISPIETVVSSALAFDESL